MFQHCKLSLTVRVVKLGGKDCTFKGEKICNGAVTKEIGKKLVKVCQDGKIKVSTRKKVGEGYPLVGRDTGEGKGIVIIIIKKRLYGGLSPALTPSQKKCPFVLFFLRQTVQLLTSFRICAFTFRFIV